MIQCCDEQKSNRENLSSPSLKIFRLCVLSVCPIFNISLLQESQCQALISFVCVEEVFINLPTESARIRQVANIPEL